MDFILERIYHAFNSRLNSVSAEYLHYRVHIGGIELAGNGYAYEHADVCNVALESGRISLVLLHVGCVAERFTDSLDLIEPYVRIVGYVKALKEALNARTDI